MSVTNQIESLNKEQQQAVTEKLGNLLVLAGAGSGKTRVLINRIAWLVQDQNVAPHSIFAVTFTNKAANEMRSRLSQSLNTSIKGIWVGTFHGLAHKLLRLHHASAGLAKDFQVLDSDAQLRIIKKIIKQLKINEDRYEPKKAQWFINRKKDDGLRFNMLPKPETSYEEVMSQIYQQYEMQCKADNLIDFAELLLLTYEIFKQDKDLLAHYQNRFKHFLIDEFQDTNAIQYKWIKLLAGSALSVTVVGDDDQSIYGWRGAEVKNIFQFEQDFSNTKVVRLEQNYRSTKTILSAANALIGNNGERLGKTLWTDGDTGEPITVYQALNEEDEALFVVRELQKIIDKGAKYSDIAILYRSNAQSRVLEEALVRCGLPYTVYGGLKFFDRAEIKDALSYLRLAVNPHDNVSLERVLNVPPRGIGDKSLEKIKDIAIAQNISIWDASFEAVNKKIISGKACTGVTSFHTIITGLATKINELALHEVVNELIIQSGLLAYFKEQKGERAQSKSENLSELVNATRDFTYEDYGVESTPVNEFLAYTALDGGEMAADITDDAVQLMTLHSAKGLEFPTVFITGIEEGLFPHHYSSDSQAELEEERRLCYVGITRAKQKLYLTHARRRRLFGKEDFRRVSRFITELPDDLLEEKGKSITIGNSYDLGKSSKKIIAASVEIGGFALGGRVKHPKFGFGTVVDHEGLGERARVCVKFDNSGTKWLVLSLAKLDAVN